MVKQLDVEGDIPVLGADDQTWPLVPEDAHDDARAAAAAAVQDGVADRHRQTGHYPWDAACEVCVEAHQRSRQHRRQQPDDATLAVDLVALGVGGPSVLVGAVQVPGQVYVEHVRS